MSGLMQRGRTLISSAPAALAVFGIAILPAFMLSVRGAAFLSFLLLLVAALWSMLASPADAMNRLRAMWHEHRWLILAMAAMPTAMLISAQLNPAAPRSVPFAYGRLWLFGLALFALLQLRPTQLESVQWGCVAGALASIVWAYLELRVGRPDMIGAFANTIPFGNLSLLMGLFSLISIGWSKGDGWLLIILRVVAGGAGLYASYLSQSRGGWIAIPVLLLIAVATLRHVAWKKRVTALLVFFALLAAVCVSSSVVRARFDQAVSDLRAYQAGQTNTSIGIRFQLWKAAALMLTRHPLAGVGRGQFEPALKAIHAEGLITQEATAVEHAHNEFLYNGATLGVLGIGALLAMYLVPAVYFVRAALCDDGILRTTGAMGLTLCVGFVLFGLTEVMLIIAQTVVFYSVMVAIFTAHIHRRRQQLGAAPVF
ncbi:MULTISPECIES: O-antigen ligase family protein [Ralstonia]|jgi:O-antigen ligase|uniref:O-antigen ligase-related domain-containing protein n=2 Tax=Ralstonia pickettii TaxID=329 RepID=A0ABM9IK31_RALPI|nr:MULTISPECIES: O-antigen ligase family protein [Ralstonia]MBA4014961.1 O-antigen ligase domain-containing protein [Ralstonia sp.]MBA4201077.1 O-antigen ligase domain-containing protein [Ralstonia sp.]MBA4229829.1 O-antigen ligase domain-containing protein [Ralstonia sp.]MBA4234709.1 O-antigen ligase domain-containing protein [Ralstonia sp.]MBA4282486.1 O-antigen ligase domain-containing protein [Ralstonia sp.]